MNILPKKRWHVRTKDNIARVTKDKAEAQKQEQESLQKQKFAESEARINFLRRQSGASLTSEIKETSTTAQPQHVNLFADFKTHIKATNKELEKEQKEEREKYEKQIGYLTYLGQDTNEALKLRSWYEVAPKRSKYATNKTIETEKDLKNKFVHDPLTLINTLLPTEKKIQETTKVKDTPIASENIVSYAESQASSFKDQTEFKTGLKTRNIKDKKSKKEKKCKKDKRHKRDKKDKKNRKQKKKRKDVEAEQQQQKKELIERLRKERLKREAIEKERQDKLLCPPETPVSQEGTKAKPVPRIVQKYNSQFNPELAKQNF